jgi:hypothetical protein
MGKIVNSISWEAKDPLNRVREFLKNSLLNILLLNNMLYF